MAFGAPGAATFSFIISIHYAPYAKGEEGGGRGRGRGRGEGEDEILPETVHLSWLLSPSFSTSLPYRACARGEGGKREGEEKGGRK